MAGFQRRHCRRAQSPLPLPSSSAFLNDGTSSLGRRHRRLMERLRTVDIVASCRRIASTGATIGGLQPFGSAFLNDRTSPHGGYRCQLPRRSHRRHCGRVPLPSPMPSSSAFPSDGTSPHARSISLPAAEALPAPTL